MQPIRSISLNSQENTPSKIYQDGELECSCWLEHISSAMQEHTCKLLDLYFDRDPAEGENALDASFQRLLETIAGRDIQLFSQEMQAKSISSIQRIWRGHLDLVEKMLIRSLKKQKQIVDSLCNGEWDALSRFFDLEATLHNLLKVTGQYLRTSSKDHQSSELVVLYIQLCCQAMVLRHQSYRGHNLHQKHELLEEEVITDMSLLCEHMDVLGSSQNNLTASCAKSLCPELNKILRFFNQGELFSFTTIYLLLLLDKISNLQEESAKEAAIFHHYLSDAISRKISMEQGRLWNKILCLNPFYFTFLKLTLNRVPTCSELQRHTSDLLDAASELYTYFIGSKDQEIALKAISKSIAAYLESIVKLLVIDQRIYSNQRQWRGENPSFQEFAEILSEQIQKKPKTAVFFSLPGFFNPLSGYGRTGQRYHRDRTILFQLPQLACALAKQYSLSKRAQDRLDHMEEQVLVDLFTEVDCGELTERSGHYMEALELLLMKNYPVRTLIKCYKTNLERACQEPRDILIKCLDLWMSKSPESLISSLSTRFFSESELIYLCRCCISMDARSKNKESSLAQSFYNLHCNAGPYGLAALYQINIFENTIRIGDQQGYLDLKESVHKIGQRVSACLSEGLFDSEEEHHNNKLLDKLISMHSSASARQWLQTALSQLKNQFARSSLLYGRLEVFMDIIFYTFLWRAQDKGRNFYQFIQSLCLSRYPVHTIRELMEKASKIDLGTYKMDYSGPKSCIHGFLLALNYHQHFPPGQRSWLQLIPYHYFKSQPQHRSFFSLFSRLFLIPQPLSAVIIEKLNQYWHNKVTTRDNIDALILRLKIMITAVTLDLNAVIEMDEDQLSLCGWIDALKKLDCSDIDQLTFWQSTVVDHYFPKQQLLKAVDKNCEFTTDFLLYYCSRLMQETTLLLKRLFAVYTQSNTSAWRRWRFDHGPYSITAHTRALREYFPECWRLWTEEKEYLATSCPEKKVLFTSQPEVILRMGSFVSGSCLHFCSPSSDENEVLASMMVDPKLKLFVLYNEKGDPVARVLATLLFSGTCFDQPTLVLHKIFPYLSEQVSWHKSAYHDLMEAIVRCCVEMQVDLLMSVEPLCFCCSSSCDESKGKACATQYVVGGRWTLTPVRVGPALCLESSVPQDLLPGHDFAMNKQGNSYYVDYCECYQIEELKAASIT